MRIIIVGAGAVGSHLADQLSKEHHDVTVIEENKERMQRLQDALDILVIQGNGASPKTLQSAGIENCDLMMALTNQDEINIVASLTACKSKVPFKIARVSNMDYYLLDNWLSEDDLGVDLLVNPEFECALQIRNLLAVPGASDVAEFGGGEGIMVGLKVEPGAPCVGETLSEIMLKQDRDYFLIGSISRRGRTLIPTGQTRLETGDQVFIFCLRSSLDDVYEFCGQKRKQVKRVMILGGSKVAVYLCKMLEKQRIRATLIENDEETAEHLAEELDQTLIIQGEPTNVEMWDLEGIGEADAFLALTRDDEENLLSGLIARSKHVPIVIALLEKLEYVPLVNQVGVNTAVSSRLAIVDTILKYVRRGNILSVTTLKGNEAEVIEFTATPRCKLLNTPLKDLPALPEVLFAMIVRGREIFIPTGHTQILEHDRVVVIAGHTSKRRLEELFQ
ncbi:Trk system potassium transporter TrkA [Sulfidibacter corallicola]|uniref:Trk system potassium uptake protein TrkA n=1 Tax=Sulfidibacter corallicola TaxID=2818388 RepID=A0A8A4TDC9_SULCO|nr:Trk system potassium transporter TrkA [Sulfidibacter corallicola]QTD48099.1 Trk system potassium transporter TrkA [Sulfidibacter corallicola]